MLDFVRELHPLVCTLEVPAIAPKDSRYAPLGNAVKSASASSLARHLERRGCPFTELLARRIRVRCIAVVERSLLLGVQSSACCRSLRRRVSFWLLAVLAACGLWQASCARSPPNVKLDGGDDHVQFVPTYFRFWGILFRFPSHFRVKMVCKKLGSCLVDLDTKSGCFAKFLLSMINKR